MTTRTDRTAELDRIVSAIQALDPRSSAEVAPSRGPLYIAIFGALLLLLPLVAGMLSWPKLSAEDMRLYVIAGALFVVAAAGCMALQALLAHGAHRARLRLALRMFEADAV